MANSDFFLADKDTVHIASMILSEAFRYDPLIRYVSTHPFYPYHIFNMLMPFYIENGEVWIEKHHRSALMCLKPNPIGKFNPNITQVISFIVNYGVGALFRLLKFAKTIERHHYKDPHYYLLAVGTTEKARNQGEGSKILRFLEMQAKLENVPIYAENSNPAKNSEIYKSLGYESGVPFRVGKRGPSLVPILLQS